MKQRWSKRLSRSIQRVRKPVSPKARRGFGLAAFVGFVVAIWLAVANLPSGLEEPHLEVLLLVGGLGAPEVLLLGAEYQQIAAIAGHRIRLGEAVRVAVLASAGNLLPLPGSVAIRTTDLVRHGSTVRSALGANALVAGIWVSLTLVLSAVVLTANSPDFGVIGTVLGTAALAVMAVLILRSVRRVPGPRFLPVLAVEGSLIALATLRIFLIIYAVGANPSVTSALVLVTAGVIATVIGIVPGGLGLREGLAALFAPLIVLPASVAVLASGLDRVLRLSVLGAVAAYVTVRPQSARRTKDERPPKHPSR